MDLNKVSAYEIVIEKDIKDLNSKGYLLKHKKTGARVLILENDDENKVFSIGFKTPPADSTGCPHIMEHSVLCGSAKFPAKDPFVELCKGSLNTFLNAMTFPDKTLYPVASCNEKDFCNLMEVYLDAVFYPNIFSKEEIFKQEGWHYELADKDSPLTINGVVYNEMKGAFSSPDDMLDREIFNVMFPDNCYGVESGGDPDVIPTLTYEKFLGFHKKYYHPSNSYIYLYGDTDMAKHLDYIDREYLSAFEREDIDTSIEYQKPFGKIMRVEKNYPITNEEPLEDNTYLAYTAVIDNVLNSELYVAFQVIECALLNAPGAILKQTLLDRGIGKDISGTYDNGTLQPYFSIVARNANAEDEQRFLDTIKEVLEKVVKEGFDKKALLGALNLMEFRYREADFGHYPKGLVYGMQAFDSWLYDDNEPFMHIEAGEKFDLMRKRIDEGYFEGLIRKYLLDSKHDSIVVFKPERGLTTRNDEKLRKKLDEYKKTLSDAELEMIVAETKHLHDYQEEPDDEETLAKIPLLSIADIKKEAMDFTYSVHNESGYTLLTHDLFTNRIGYLTLVFNTKNVSEELLPYVGILRNVLGYVDTANYKFSDLFNEISLVSGGITGTTGLFVNDDDPTKFDETFEIKSKVLYENLHYATDMISEILFTSDFSDNKRLYEIICMLKSQFQSFVSYSGNAFAASRAMSGISKTAYIDDKISGLTFYRTLERLVSDFDNEVVGLKEKLSLCMKAIFAKDTFMVADYTAAESEYENALKCINSIYEKLPDKAVNTGGMKYDMHVIKEAYKSSAKVQYVAKGGRYLDDNHPYTGALKVARVIMGYDYLWNQVRVVGGAYGCSAMFSKGGYGYFASYRDPNLKKTLDVYDSAADYLRKFDADERTMTKYIIGTIAGLDAPCSPADKGRRSLTAYMTNNNLAKEQKIRDEILSCDVEDIRGLASYLEKIISTGCICCVGGEDMIEESKDLFDKTEFLFLQ